MTRHDEPGHRQYVITADDPANLPVGYGDLVLVYGLVRRGELNNRFAKAHGRNSKGREGLTLLIGGEEIWCPKQNIRLVITLENVKTVCSEDDITEEERVQAIAFLENP